jgi:hypothetical protein
MATTSSPAAAPKSKVGGIIAIAALIALFGVAVWLLLRPKKTNDPPTQLPPNTGGVVITPPNQGQSETGSILDGIANVIDSIGGLFKGKNKGNANSNQYSAIDTPTNYDASNNAFYNPNAVVIK